MDMMIVVSVIALAIVMMVAYKGLKTKQPSDSILRQRALFNTEEQITFSRLKEILPEAHIFAHVSFDALLTTKFPRTRRKYESLFADFVVLDQSLKVIVVISMGDSISNRRNHSAIKKDALLQAAGYRLVRYEHAPDYQQLQAVFLSETIEMQAQALGRQSHLGKSEMYAASSLDKLRIYG